MGQLLDKVSDDSDFWEKPLKLILATLLGCQGLDVYKDMLPKALDAGLTPVMVKEMVYQAVDYLGIGRVMPFLSATNDILTARGVHLPLPAQATTDMENRLEKGAEVYARSSLLQGLLLMDAERLPENMYFAKEYIKHFSAICKEYEVSPLRTAVCYVGRHSGIDYVVFGVDNKGQLLEYLSMQEEDIPADMVKELQKEFEDVEEKLVNPVLWNH